MFAWSEFPTILFFWGWQTNLHSDSSFRTSSSLTRRKVYHFVGLIQDNIESRVVSWNGVFLSHIWIHLVYNSLYWNFIFPPKESLWEKCAPIILRMKMGNDSKRQQPDQNPHCFNLYLYRPKQAWNISHWT